MKRAPDKEPMSIDPLTLRQSLGNFLTGVTIVTTRTPDGAPVGLTVNSFNSVSLDPPLVLFSLARDAECFAHFQAGDRFAINVLGAHQAELSTRFATRNIDKWAGIPVREGEIGLPLIEDAIATFECRVHARHEGGDHVIYVGEVLALDAREEAEPLGFYQGRYASLRLPGDD